MPPSSRAPARPRVSVIVPCHDDGPYLDAAVDSVVGQRFDDWELIVVDDGSRDDTREIATRRAAEDPRVRWVRQEHLGLASARNHGLREARGELIQLLDADDRLDPDKLALQVAALDRHPEIDVLFCGARFLGGAAEPPPLPSPRVRLATQLLLGNVLVVNAALTRRRAFDRWGAFRERSSTRHPMYGCEDWELWLRFAVGGARFAYTGDALVANAWRPESMSRHTLSMRRSAVWVLEELCASRPALSPAQRALLHQQLFYRRVALAAALAEAGDAHGARAELAVAFAGRDEPGALETLLDPRPTRDLLAALNHLAGRIPYRVTRWMGAAPRPGAVVPLR